MHSNVADLFVQPKHFMVRAKTYHELSKSLASDDQTDVSEEHCQWSMAAPSLHSLSVRFVGREPSTVERKPSSAVGTKPSGGVGAMPSSIRDGPRDSTKWILGKNRSPADMSHRVSVSGPTVKNPLFHGIVSSTCFSVVAIAIVTFHSLLMMVETDYDIGAGPGSVHFALDILALMWYCTEIVLRVAAQGFGWGFLCDGWNILDSVLTCIVFVDLALCAFSEADDDLSVRDVVSNLQLLRLARLFRYISPLWLLVCGITKSMRTVIWAWFMVGLAVYIFGLGFARVLAPHTCGDDGEDADLQLYFGSVSKSMFSVFQCVTLEDWHEVANQATDKEPWLRFFFWLLLATTSWGVMHAVVAVFVKCALEASSVRASEIARRTQQDHMRNVRQICELFCLADSDGNGALTAREFAKVLDDQRLEPTLHAVGVDKKWASALFDILDLDSSQMLDGPEFVEGVLRSSGPALNKDVIGLRCDVWRASTSVSESLATTSEYVLRRLSMSASRINELQEDMEPVMLRLRRLASPTHPASVQEEIPDQTVHQSDAPSAGATGHIAKLHLGTRSSTDETRLPESNDDYTHLERTTTGEPLPLPRRNLSSEADIYDLSCSGADDRHVVFNTGDVGDVEGVAGD